MTNLDWLMDGDPVIVHFVRKYLFEEPSKTQNRGFIQRYLELVDQSAMKWGNGYYSPKFVSTHYTLFDLKYMEIMPETKDYLESLQRYLDNEWRVHISHSGIEHMDLCITGMFINMLAYGSIEDQRMNRMIDYVLDHPMPDGGWNCRWNRTPLPHMSSVHTTVNVLEGLIEYQRQGYQHRSTEVGQAIEQGIRMLLDRQLIFKKGTHTPIHPAMAEHHFPFRWKYDYLRILELLARLSYPYEDNMQPALELLEKHLIKGKLSKGTKISGQIHFPVENERFGRFNTARAYIVFKAYRPELYRKCMNQDF